MDVVVERCAGLDVHRDDVVATVRVPGAGRRRWDQQTRTFRATLAGLAARERNTRHAAERTTQRGQFLTAPTRCR